LAALCLLSPCFAAAQATSYAVEMRGAGKFSSLLDDYLEIRRHEHDADIGDDELRRLAGAGVQQIRDLLATEGFFSPKAAYQLLMQDGRRIVRYDVDLGPPTVVDKVDLRFAGELATGPHADQRRIARLKRLWRLDPGMRFRQADWEASKSALLADLINRAYPAAKIVSSQARIDPDQRSAQLSVDVDSGPLFTFGDLQIKGLQRYSRERIDALNPIKPGEPYSQEKLTELQSRLQDSGYFRTVFATVDVDPAHPREVPVRVDLAENERRRLGLGIGFSTDAGPRAQVKWLDRQFLGHDWRLESEVRADRLDQLAGADLYFPALKNGWYPSVGAHAERSNVEGQVTDKVRNDWRVTSPNKFDEEIWAISYLGDRQYLPLDFVNNRQALVLTYTYTRRRLDSLLNPRRGHVASIELDGGPRGFLNQANIGRVVVRSNWLITLAPRWHAQLRGEFGKVMGAGRELVPDDLLFRTGGDQTVRGYAYNSLGVAQNGAIVGGTIEAVASAELVRYLTPTWGVAVFRDAGNAADSWRDFKFAQGTGVGVRWRSPIGPVNVDFAYGHATHQPRLHFSVGYGF
jgi:translocation and assembly module TamA